MAMVDDTDVVRVTKTNREKYLNDDAYVHLTRDRYIKSDNAPKPFKKIKRKPRKAARVVVRDQMNGARA
jgi:hypothetical protein